MKRNIISIITSIVILVLCSAPCFTTSADITIDSYITQQYIKQRTEPDIDRNLFDYYVKYSLDVQDYNGLSDKKQELCRFIFETERSDIAHIYCPYARNAVLSEDMPERISFDNPSTISAIVNPYPSYYEFFSGTSVLPDIIYTDFYDVFSEYWLDDYGTERIIVSNANTDIFEYIKFYDEMPVDSEIVKNIVNSEDGKTFIYSETMFADNYENDYSQKKFKCGIWEYEIMPDGNAVITDCLLPKYSKAVPIEETFVLPTELDGRTVEGIYDAISGTGITKLVIPDSIKYINSVSNMEFLKEVNINAPELELRSGSFICCPVLDSIELNVRTISGKPFMECYAIKEINILSSEEISSDSFCNLPELISVRLPDNLKAIGQCAFSETALKELEIPKNTRIIGKLKMPYFNTVDNIADTVTDNSILITDSDCIIKGWYGTETHIYALKHNLTFFPLDELLYGDVNNDGVIRIADAVALQNYLLRENNTISYESDVNRDGRTDVFDMIEMRKIINQIIADNFNAESVYTF